MWPCGIQFFYQDCCPQHGCYFLLLKEWSTFPTWKSWRRKPVRGQNATAVYPEHIRGAPQRGGTIMCRFSHLMSALYNSAILSVPQCEFLQSDSSGPAAVLSPCVLKVAISDMSQLMMAFGHIYNTDFKGYCQRTPPALSSRNSVFQSVHQLLHTCNKVKHWTSFIWNRLTEIQFNSHLYVWRFSQYT